MRLEHQSLSATGASLPVGKRPQKTTGAYRKMWGEDGNGTRPF